MANGRNGLLEAQKDRRLSSCRSKQRYSRSEGHVAAALCHCGCRIRPWKIISLTAGFLILIRLSYLPASAERDSCRSPPPPPYWWQVVKENASAAWRRSVCYNAFPIDHLWGFRFAGCRPLGQVCHFLYWHWNEHSVVSPLDRQWQLTEKHLSEMMIIWYNHCSSMI